MMPCIFLSPIFEFPLQIYYHLFVQSSLWLGEKKRRRKINEWSFHIYLAFGIVKKTSEMAPLFSLALIWSITECSNPNSALCHNLLSRLYVFATYIHSLQLHRTSSIYCLMCSELKNETNAVLQCVQRNKGKFLPTRLGQFWQI